MSTGGAVLYQITKTVLLEKDCPLKRGHWLTLNHFRAKYESIMTILVRKMLLVRRMVVFIAYQVQRKPVPSKAIQ
ncbi:hypothetical protein EAE90_14275 [Photorhabdus caribbeanensis]|nr:hypothetical protein [Photorhabdus caribbeanensis]